MKLSKENSRRLTYRVWRERITSWLVPALVMAIVGAGFVLLQNYYLPKADAVVEARQHAATVIAFEEALGRQGSKVRVHLDDGRDVDAYSRLAVFPARGTHLVINELKHASGRLTFDVLRVTE
ncbi:MAG: hypothetical protein RLZ98_939 [Pseudomonadota bacterium]|jgi:hypothetical protein